MRLDLDKIEVMRPENLAKVAAQGISAMMFVRSVGGYDDKPQSASVRLIHTVDGSLIAGLAWQNGRGGAQGSPVDAMMRKDVVDAATEIAQSLAEQLDWPRYEKQRQPRRGRRSRR